MRTFPNRSLNRLLRGARLSPTQINDAPQSRQRITHPKAHPMRHRHALYLSDSMTQALELAAETHRVSKSAILELALQTFLAPTSNSPTDNLGQLQHSANARSLSHLRHEVAIVGELLATLTRFIVSVTPRMPVDEQAAARAHGNLRFEQAVEDVARRLRTDHSLMAQVEARLGWTRQETSSDSPGRSAENATAASQSAPGGPAEGDRNG